jgi:hypothetical protein
VNQCTITRGSVESFEVRSGPTQRRAELASDACKFCEGRRLMPELSTDGPRIRFDLRCGPPSDPKTRKPEVFGWCSAGVRPCCRKRRQKWPNRPAKAKADARIRTADPFITSLRSTHHGIRSFAGNSSVRALNPTPSNSAVLHAPPGMCSNGVPIASVIGGNSTDRDDEPLPVHGAVCEAAWCLAVGDSADSCAVPSGSTRPHRFYLIRS